MSPVVTSRAGEAAASSTSLLILPLAKGTMPPSLTVLDRACSGAIARCWESGDFTGARDETALFYTGGTSGIRRVLLIGMGPADQVTASALRRAAMIGGKKARVIGAADVSLQFLPDAAPGVAPAEAGQALAEGVPFGAWHFADLKRPPESPKPRFERCEIVISGDAREFQAGVARGIAIAAGQSLTRGLQVLPGNTCTPEFVAERARDIASRYGFEITVLDLAGIRAAGMHALLAVAQGSAVEPRFVVLEYRGSTDRPIVFVGKGVTFDTGGISIKPAQNMEDMKYDMSGAAAVLGTFEALGQLKPAQHVIGLIPLAENMPSGTAYRPGDVVSSHLGKTIEVVNTDAEGRLILADALSWARQYQPVAVVDCATLTGAIVIGLGHTASGVMGTDEPLIQQLIAAGTRADERIWQLPIWDDYRELIKSDIADMKNSGGRAAGSITAGWFLREFAEDYPWAHIDIAGTAYTDRELPTQVKGPTGVMVRLFTEFLRARA